MSAENQFGTFFRTTRKALGLNLREFCRRNGYDPGNISRLRLVDESRKYFNLHLLRSNIVGDVFRSNSQLVSARNHLVRNHQCASIGAGPGVPAKWNGRRTIHARHQSPRAL